MMSEPHNHLSLMADSVYLQVSLLQHPSNQPPVEGRVESSRCRERKRSLGPEALREQLLGQGLLGWLPRRQPQAQAEMGYNLTTSALPPSRGFPSKHIASCHLSPQQRRVPLFPGGSRSASTKTPSSPPTASTLRSSCHSPPASEGLTLLLNWPLTSLGAAGRRQSGVPDT